MAGVSTASKRVQSGAKTHAKVGSKTKAQGKALGGHAGAKTHGKPPHKSDKPDGVEDAGGDAKAAAELQALGAKLDEGAVAWFEAAPALKSVKPAVAESGGKKQKRGKKAEPEVLVPTPGATTFLATDALVLEKKKLAQRLLEQEVARFEAKKSGKMSSDDKYLATMIKAGTLSDRVASLTLTVQGSPFHSIARLGQLIAMANKKARRESLMAVDSLKDLFINNLLPDDRKLRFFHQNPLDHPSATPTHLVLWFFEHCLKTAFAQLVGVLSSGMEDAVDNHKRACIRASNALLAAKPEQEAVLLAMLVNKLGDPDRKIAAYIHKTLQELLREHPVMKRVVVDEVERLLTRPKVSDRAKYNAVLFLNQIYLDASGDDAELAAHLITVYFGLFSKEVHGSDANGDKKKHKSKGKKKTKKNDKNDALTNALDRKLLSALLLGVNRAFPYTNATSADFQKEIDTLFAVVHKGHHSTSVQALMLLFQVMNSTNSVSDRFYVALYDKLLDPRLRETSKHTAFLNLVFRAMKADVSPARISAMVKRLLQVAIAMPPAFACAVLFLLSELLKVKPQLRTLIDQPEASGGNRQEEEHFDDAEAARHLDKEEEEDTEEEGDDEVARDDGRSDAEQSSNVLAKMFGGLPDDAPAAPASSAVVSFDDEEGPAKTVSSKEKDAGDDGYDPRKRNPLYAKADTSCAWELDQLARHYHPSVQMFTRQVLENRPGGIQYSGDPLVDFTMLAFFEKFVNKKPRHRTSTPVAGSAPTKSWTFAAINSEAVLEQSEDTLDASDKFFYKFFQERANREATTPSRRRKKKSADDDRDDDPFSDVDADGDEDEDEEMEAYAQQLAEGIMQDGDMDDEDPNMEGWDDDEDDDDEDEPKHLDGEIDGDDDDDADEGEAAHEFGEDSDEDVGQAGSDGEDEDDEDEDEDEDGLNFAAMTDDVDENDDVLQQELSALKSKQTPPSSSSSGKKRKKTLFASADDYEQLVRDALAQQKVAAKSKKRRSQ